MSYEKSIPQWLEQELRSLGVTEAPPNKPPATEVVRDYSFKRVELDENGEPPF